MEIPDKLDKIIKKIILLKKINLNDFLFKCSKTAFVLKINKIFEKYINKKISVNIIRHSRITFELNNSKLNEKDKYILPQKMAHSISTQSLYKKIISSDSDEDDVEKDNIDKININAADLIINHQKIMKPFIGRPIKYNTIEEKKEAKKEAKKRFLIKQKIIKEKKD